ncbi:MAG: hypothetical protein ACOYNS_10995 [Bacteroidota bacterium]
MLSVLSAYLRTSRIQIAALIYFLIAGGLTQVPLFNYLGYEFSAAMAIPAAFISGILTIKFMREHRVKPLTRRTWLFVLSDYLLVNTLLLLIPLGVITLNAFAVKNCAYLTGLLYYLLITEGAVIFSISLALVIGVTFRHGIILFCVAVTGLLFHILFVTYTQPQLFAYNFILGFFPGITYDETLSDIYQIVLYREFTVIASLMMIALFIILAGAFHSSDSLMNNLRAVKKQFYGDKKLWMVVLFCLLIVGAGHLFRGTLGFEYSEAEIQNALGRRSESDHFIVYYQENDFTAEQMRVLKAECEFHFRKMSEYLELNDIHLPKTAVYLYPNSEWKQRFIGTSNTNIAKPWKHEIHLTVGTFETTFRHELVHALAGAFGLPLINASAKMGLNEGLAVASDWDDGLFTPHEYAAALLRDGKLDNTSRLFTYSGFATQSSSYAYLVSGSFVRYLIERYGIERFRLVFPNGNFMGVFGESLDSLLKDWKVFLKSVETSALPPETINVLFGQQSIFYKTCAREVAAQNQRGSAALREKDYRRAQSEFEQAFSNAQTTGALRGIFQTLNAQNLPGDVKRRYEEFPNGSSLRNHPGIQLSYADALYLIGVPDSAMSYYRAIGSMNISESFIETSLLRMQFLKDGVSPGIFHRLIFNGLPDTVRIGLIDSLLLTNRETVSLEYLKAMLQSPLDGQRMHLLKKITARISALQYFIYLRTADECYRNHAFEEAKLYYWHAKNTVPSIAAAGMLDEKIERCDFVMMELQ